MTIADRLRRRVVRLLSARLAHPGTQSSVRSAVVEVFERHEIAGWVEVQPGTDPVRVDLCVNDVSVAQTWAAPTTGRRVYGDLLEFRFVLIDLWMFTQRKDRVSVRIDRTPLPIMRKGTFYRPRRDGTESLEVLRERLAAGYVFGQDGRLRLSKALDTEWQSAVLGLYGRVNEVLEDRFQVRAFLCYGTLLGAVRDNGFIGHDVDFDCAYISPQRTGQAAAEELGAVAFELVDRGFNVVPKRTCLAVEDDLSGGTKIDLYHLYRDESGRLSFPFGIAGSPEATHGDFSGVRTIRLAGHDVLVPTDAERLVEAIYGSNWRTPNPGFRWLDDRTLRSREGIVTVAQVDEVARANLAASQAGQRGPIRSLLSSAEQLPGIVVEIGSSLGDDSVEIARSGRRVVGLERSRLSVERAVRRVASQNLAGSVEFRTVEINDPERLAVAIDELRRESEGTSLAFYARSFLRFSDRALRSLLTSLDQCGRDGDYLVADFRVAPAGMWPKDKSPDAKPSWNQAALLAELEDRPTWTVVSSKQAEASDDDHAHQRPGVVVARHGVSTEQ